MNYIILMLIVVAYYFVCIIQPVTLFSSFLHQTVNTTLSAPARLFFKIRVEKLNGVILYCIDTHNNQFAIDLVGEGYGEALFRIRFNKIVDYVPLKTLCGYDPFENMEMRFTIELNIGKVDLDCDLTYVHTLSLTDPVPNLDIEKSENRYYAIPKIITNQEEKTLIMIGNVGEGNITAPQLDAQLIGCLESFYYNGNPIIFFTKGEMISNLCPNECSKNLCNSGICKEAHGDITCDCSSTVFNGLYCNRTLKRYNIGDNNTYKKEWWKKKIDIKMSWKSSGTTNFCLMEIVGGWRNDTIGIEGNRLLVNSKVITTVNIKEVEFVSVSINQNYLMIKTKYNQSKIPYNLSRNTHVNIGFSEQTGKCEKFEGLYDIKLDLIRINSTKPPYSRVNMTFITTTLYVESSRYHDSTISSNSKILWMTPVFSIGGIIILFIIVLIVIKKEELIEDRNIYDEPLPINTRNVQRMRSGEYDEHISAFDEIHFAD